MADDLGIGIQTEELERSVIGALCIDPEIFRSIRSGLLPEDFSLSPCKAVFERAEACMDAGEPFDALIAAEAASERLGNDGKEFIKLCIVTTPTSANAAYHARLLHERAASARLRKTLLDDIMDLSAEPPAELAATVIGRCRAFLDGERSGRTVSLGRAITEYYNGLGGTRSLIRVDTGFPKLDSILKGVWGGNLVLIGARPGVGKSAMALSIAEHAAKNGGKVLIYSMEMQREELAERAIARYGPKLDDLIEAGDPARQPDGFFTDLIASCGQQSRLPIYINDSPHMTVSRMRSEAAATDGLTLVIVDFLGLMQSDRKYEKHYLELGAISRDLKNLAAELGVPIIALSQLNRERDERERPTLSNLRDSGELEQNANKVLLMWNEDKEAHKVGVSVAKNRRGKTGSVEMLFDGDHMRYEEIDFLRDEPAGKRRGGKYRGKDEDW